jgi:predicted alpha/beta superfamily hydrolase
LKRNFLTFLGLLLYSTALAQYKVTIVATIPNNTKKVAYYLAGNFNNWNPKSSTHLFSQNTNNTYTCQFTSIAARIECKITQGSWQTVESTTTGQDVENRVFQLQSDTTLYIAIAAFKNNFEPTAKTSTASAQVKIISDSFFIPQLNVKRRIWIYLPKSYDGKKKYPVLYMQDGQNLFDATTSGFGEWKIDEYLDQNSKEIIVVGVDHGGANRLKEYDPYQNKLAGIEKPLGKEYANFIATTLKEYIDKTYSTKKDKANTFIAGSSMGALISYYTAIQYPSVYGKVGVFSPAFWINMPALKTAITKITKLTKTDFYFYAGSNESENLVKEVIQIHDATLIKCKNCRLKISIKANGTHNEKSWEIELPNFFSWLLQ